MTQPRRRQGRQEAGEQGGPIASWKPGVPGGEALGQASGDFRQGRQDGEPPPCWRSQGLVPRGQRSSHPCEAQPRAPARPGPHGAQSPCVTPASGMGWLSAARAEMGRSRTAWHGPTVPEDGSGAQNRHRLAGPRLTFECQLSCAPESAHLIQSLHGCKSGGGG